MEKYWCSYRNHLQNILSVKFDGLVGDRRSWACWRTEEVGLVEGPKKLGMWKFEEAGFVGGPKKMGL
jgi:hypothetical protein